MSYQQLSKRDLPSLFQAGPVVIAAEQMARDVNDRLLDEVIQNTPIGGLNEGSGRGGNLRTSWREKPLVKFYTSRGEAAYTTGIETEVEYAPDVEYGTGLFGPEGRKYIIEAKPGKWLSWITTKPFQYRDKKTGKFGKFVPAGTRVYFKRVLHPGSPGQHMVAIACAVVEAELERVTQAALREFARNVEKGTP